MQKLRTDVDKHVQDAHGDDRNGSCQLEGPHGVPHLAHRVVCIGVPDVGPDDVVQRGHHSV